MRRLQLGKLAALVVAGLLLASCGAMGQGPRRQSGGEDLGGSTSVWSEAGASSADAEAGLRADAGPDGQLARDGGGATSSAFAIVSTAAQPTEIAPGGMVSISVQIKAMQGQALAGGQLWLVARAPDGRLFTQKSLNVEIAAGETLTVKQECGPYSVVGDWVFTPTLHDSAEAVLADGSEKPARVMVKTPGALDTPIPGTLKVLVYSGPHTGTYGVQNSQTLMDLANRNNSVTGVKYSYATSTTITADTLAGYQVLIMPGGDSGRLYLESSNISGAALKSFVNSGGGYVGTCAGAYAAVKHVDGYYDGWGLAPNVTAKAVSFGGNLPVAFTAEGTSMLGESGTQTLHHWNGPAMYKKPETGPALVLATYADNSTKYSGLAAIVADTYGSGRTILFGPHPELEPQFPLLLARAIAWAGKAL